MDDMFPILSYMNECDARDCDTNAEWTDFQNSLGKLTFLSDIEEGTAQRLSEEAEQTRADKLFETLRTTYDGDELARRVREHMNKGADPNRPVSSELQFKAGGLLTYETPMDLAMRLRHVHVVSEFANRGYYPTFKAYFHLLHSINKEFDTLLCKDTEIKSAHYYNGILRDVSAIVQVSRDIGERYSRSVAQYPCASADGGDTGEQDEAKVRHMVQAARLGVEKRSDPQGKYRGVLDYLEEQVSASARFMGITPLTAASKDISSVEIISSLIDAGADVLEIDLNMMRPMENAIMALAHFLPNMASAFRRFGFNAGDMRSSTMKEEWKRQLCAKNTCVYFLVKKTVEESECREREEAASKAEATAVAARSEEARDTGDDDLYLALMNSSTRKRQRT